VLRVLTLLHMLPGDRRTDRQGHPSRPSGLKKRRFKTQLTETNTECHGGENELELIAPFLSFMVLLTLDDGDFVPTFTHGQVRGQSDSLESLLFQQGN